MISYMYDAKGYYFDQIEDYGFAPNNSTRVPPEIREGFIPKWDGSAWQNIENHKDKKGYLNGEPYKIKEYGPYPAGFSLTPPEPTEKEKLAAAKAAKFAEIGQSYEAAMAASLTMPKDAPSATDVAIGAALFASEDAEGLEYIAEQHSQRKAALESQVETAETLEEVQAIEVNYAV